MLAPAFLVLVLAATSPPAGGSPSPPTGGDFGRRPKLVVPEAVVDFGTVPKGQDLVWEFELRNEGGQFLDIADERRGLYVTIPPGGSWCYPVSVETRHFSGPIAKSMTLRTNDLGIDDPPPLLRPEPPRGVVITPREGGFVRTRTGHEVSGSVRLEQAAVHPLRVRRIATTSPELDATVQKVGEKSYGNWRYARHRLDFRLTPRERHGRFREEIHVYPDDSEDPIVVPVVCDAFFPYGLGSASIDFGALCLASRAPRERAASLSFLDDEAKTHRLLGAEIVEAGARSGAKPRLRLTSRELPGSASFQFVVEVLPDAAPGPIDSHLLLETDDPIAPVFVVPITGELFADARAGW